MMSRILAPLTVALLLAAAAGPSPAQADPAQAGTISLTDPLPVDPAVKIGRLPNGLTYYLQRNTEPAKRAELRLVVKAGALQEDDDQQGMAHLIEHMGFNGTRNFRKNDLVQYLRSLGVRFGADLNASTGYESTVYMLQIPTDSAGVVEKGVLILADWANGIVFDSAEVAKERGVAVEEWRGAQGSGARVRRKLAPVIYRGSKYANRNVIGSEASIMSASPALLKRYYDDWYRPDLQAVIVVGDVDVTAIEALIRKHFGSIPPIAKARPLVVEEVPDNREPLIAVATDREVTGTSVVVSFKVPRARTRNGADSRQRMVESFALSMLRSRLGEIARKPDAPFLGASVGKSGFSRTREAFTLSVNAKDGGAERALEAVVAEVLRARRFGFLQSELDRIKASALRGLEQSWAERDKRRSGGFAGAYIGHFLDDAPIPPMELMYRMGKQVIPGVTIEEVNALVSRWITDENRVITAVAPEKPGVPAPTEAALLAALERGWHADVAAYSENVSTEPLVPNPPAPGRVAGGKTRADLGITEWTLSNGARVIVKPTDFRADEVMFAGYSFGGTSVLPDSMLLDAQFASMVVGVSGVGAFDRTSLGKRLAGKAASVSPYVSGLLEGMRGSASPKDLTTLFELLHLYFTAPRYDTTAVKAALEQQRVGLSRRGITPESHFEDTIYVTMGNNHPRDQLMSVERLAQVHPERAFQLYRERFADAGDFTFIFVGTVDTTALKPLVERYIASLPSAGRREQWKDVGIRPPTGVIRKTVRKGTEPKSQTRAIFTGPFEYSDANEFVLGAMLDVVRNRLIETLREELSGTYAPSLSGYGAPMPRPNYRITLSFGSSPENAERLFQAAMGVIDSIKAHGPAQSEVDKVREQMIRSRELAIKQNGWWMSTILGRDQTGADIAARLGPWDAMIRALTPEQVQQAARTYFDMDNYARFVLLPEKTIP